MSLLFVELANAEVLKDIASPHLTQNGVMISADQSHEAAVAEVRAHYGLKDDAYHCAFSQRRPERQRSVFIAPSAWTNLDPNLDLELFVVPLAKTESTPEAGMGDRELERASIATLDERDKVTPLPSQAASQSASSVVAPATPSNTDDSASEVSDSDTEAGPARFEPLSASVRKRQASAPRDIDYRDRSDSPSPSNRSAKAALRSAIEETERVMMLGSSCRAPSPVQPQQTERLGSLTPPSHTLDPAHLCYSIDSHASFRIGLDDIGNVAFVPPSPSTRGADMVAGPSSSAKGKGRAISSVSDQEEDAVEHERPVKAEPASSQPRPFLAFAAPPPLRFALKARSSDVVEASSSSNDTSRASADTSGAATEVSSASVETSSGQSSSKLASDSQNSGSSSTRPRDSYGNSPQEATNSSTSFKRPRDSFVASSQKATPTGVKRPAPSVDTPRKRLQHSLAHGDSPARSGGNATSASSVARSAGRKSIVDKRRDALADKRREALARPRVAVPETTRSSRFHYWLRLPNWPAAPRNEKGLKPVMLFKQGARGDDTLGVTVQYVFEAAAKETGWAVRDLRFTFYPKQSDGTAGRMTVWGWDQPFTGFRDLEELGLNSGDVIDIDHIPYNPDRSYLDEE